MRIFSQKIEAELIPHWLKKKKILGKLYFFTLNYTSYYTLYHILFECTICTLNYDCCYTLHPDIKFDVNLDRSSKFNMQSVIRSIV